MVDCLMSGRKLLSTKLRRDDSFGIMARREVCNVFHKLLPSFERAGLIASDVYQHWAGKTNGAEHKIKSVVENEKK